MSKPSQRSEALVVVSLLLLAAVVRSYVAGVTYVIQRDGVTYVTLARQIASGQALEALSYPLSHPLYPLLMAGLSKVTGDFVLAGAVISILLGTLTLVPFYLLARALVGIIPALLAMALLALHPYHTRFSATVLADPTYIFLVSLALLLGFRQAKGDSLLYGVWAGLAVGLAYLVKPEGMAVLPVVLLAPLLVRSAGPRSKGRIALAMLMPLVGFLVMASPYLIFLRQLTGSWMLTQKVQVGQLAALGGSLSLPTTAYEWPRTFAETLHPLFLAVLVVGIVYRKEVVRRQEARYGLAFVALFALLTFFRLASSGYLSKRQVLPMAMVCLWWSGVGLVEAAALLERLRRRRKPVSVPPGKSSADVSWKMLTIVTAFVVVLVSIKTLAPQGRAKLPLKYAGQWLVGYWNAPHPPRAYHWALSRPLFYAEAYRFDSNLADRGLSSYREVLAYLQERDADLFVAQESDLQRDIPDWPPAEKLEDMVLAHREPIGRKQSADHVLVFALDHSGDTRARGAAPQGRQAP